ncbi:MAG: hypothetical protein QOJ42_2408, partial [Acidobacteriaceae bacterium]|nr:hypothetical protein [Acidobacteriaceae bacterium]
MQNYGRRQAEGRRPHHAAPPRNTCFYLLFPMVISAIRWDEGQTVRALKTAYHGSDVAGVKIKRPYKAHRVALGVRGTNARRVRHPRGKS